MKTKVLYQDIFRKKSSKAPNEFHKYVFEKLVAYQCQDHQWFADVIPTKRTNFHKVHCVQCIQSECKKIRTRITPNTDTFYEGVSIKVKRVSLNFYTNFRKVFVISVGANNDINNSMATLAVVCYFQDFVALLSDLKIEKII